MEEHEQKIRDKELRAKYEQKIKSRNVFLSGVKANGTTKRFFKEVGVEEVEAGEDHPAGWVLTLGKRKVQTPNNVLFVVPTEELALAIALEWDAQVDFIKPSRMPLTHLAVVALDQMTDIRNKVLRDIKQTLLTDPTLHRIEEPRAILKLQKKFHQPQLDWFKEEHGCHFNVTNSLLSVQQPPKTVEKICGLFAKQPDWYLAALDSLVTLTKSSIVTWAVFLGRMTLDQAFEACRVEENYQIRKFGKVEGAFGHDIDIEYTKLKLSAALTFFNFLGSADPASLRTSSNDMSEADKILSGIGGDEL